MCCFTGIFRKSRPRRSTKPENKQIKQAPQFSGEFVLPEEGSLLLFNLPFGTLTFNRTQQIYGCHSELCFEAEDAHTSGESITDEGIFALIEILGKVFAACEETKFVLTFDFRLIVHEPMEQLAILYKTLSWDRNPDWPKTLSQHCIICRVAVLPEHIAVGKQSMDKFFKNYPPACPTYLLDNFDRALGDHSAVWMVGADGGASLASDVVGGLGSMGSVAGNAAVSAAFSMGAVGVTAVGEFVSNVPKVVKEAVNEPLPNNAHRDILVPWIP